MLKWIKSWIKTETEINAAREELLRRSQPEQEPMQGQMSESIASTFEKAFLNRMDESANQDPHDVVHQIARKTALRGKDFVRDPVAKHRYPARTRMTPIVPSNHHVDRIQPDLALAYAVLAPIVAEAWAYLEGEQGEDSIAAAKKTMDRAKFVVDSVSIPGMSIEIKERVPPPPDVKEHSPLTFSVRGASEIAPDKVNPNPLNDGSP